MVTFLGQSCPKNKGPVVNGAFGGDQLPEETSHTCSNGNLSLRGPFVKPLTKLPGSHLPALK